MSGAIQIKPEAAQRLRHKLRRKVGRPTRPGVGTLQVTWPDGETEWYFCPCCQLEEARQVMLEDSRIERQLLAGRRPR